MEDYTDQTDNPIICSNCARDADSMCLICEHYFCGEHIAWHLKEKHSISILPDPVSKPV